MSDSNAAGPALADYLRLGPVARLDSDGLRLQALRLSFIGF